jgi:serine/threonine protein kinase
MIDHFKDDQKVTLIDFGLSSSYLNQHLQHIPFKSTEKIVGTPMYASNNALLGKEISRRDDIESMIYILIFCLKGYLPWHGVLNLDFLQSENAKKKILQMRDPDGPLLRDIPLELRSLLTYA